MHFSETPRLRQIRLHLRAGFLLFAGFSPARDRDDEVITVFASCRLEEHPLRLIPPYFRLTKRARALMQGPLIRCIEL